MSAETLKFFEEKSTEQIINWMLMNLREDQIRMCLDKSGIPDTSVIREEPSTQLQPLVASSAAAAAPLAESEARAAQIQSAIQERAASSVTGTQMQPSTGAGPSGTGTFLFDRSQSVVSPNELDEQSKRCQQSGILIKSITDGNVEFYQVVEVDEDKDEIISQNVNDGEYGWVKKIIPLETFKTKMCDPEDIEIYVDARVEAEDKFTTNVPEEVMDVAKSYNYKGIQSSVQVPVDITPAAEQTSDVVEVTNVMREALEIQKKSPKVMRENFDVLFNLGMTFFPVFIYGYEDDETFKYLATVVDPVTQKLKFEERTTRTKIAKKRFRDEVRSILEAYEKKNYVPDGNITEELKVLQNNLSPEIKNKLDQIYNPLRQDYFTYFGDNYISDSDEEPVLMPLISRDSILNDPSMSPPMSRSMSPPMPRSMSPPMPPPMSPTTTFSKKRKPSEMSIPELEEHMKIKFGPKFARDYKPELYTNSIGVRNVRYVKRDICDTKDSMPEVSVPMFPDFASELNSNNFGDMDGSNSELLFGSHCDDD